MFRLAMYYTAADLNAALTAIAPVVDQSLTSSPNDTGFVVPENTRFLAGGFGVMEPASALQIQFQSPELRKATYPTLEPFTLDASVPASPIPENYWGENPFELKPPETLQAFVNSDEAVAQYVGAYLSDGPLVQAPGKIFSAAFTATVQASAGAYAAGPITLGQPLDSGNYQVVGMRIRGTGLVCGRLIFPDQTPRPGCPAANGLGGLDAPWARFGKAGIWGEFDTTNLPQLEVLGGVAAAQSGILDLIRI